MTIRVGSRVWCDVCNRSYTYGGEHRCVEYPPLTPVEEYPLHGWDYDGRRYACQGAGDNHVYDWRCPVCVSLAELWVNWNGDDLTGWKQSLRHLERQVLVSWLIERSRALGVERVIIQCGCVYDKHDTWCMGTPFKNCEPQKGIHSMPHKKCVLR